LHSIAKVGLDPGVADRVGAAAGEEWLLVTGVRWTEWGGMPLAFIESYVPTEFEPIVESFWTATGGGVEPSMRFRKRSSARDLPPFCARCSDRHAVRSPLAETRRSGRAARSDPRTDPNAFFRFLGCNLRLVRPEST